MSSKRNVQESEKVKEVKAHWPRMLRGHLLRELEKNLSTIWVFCHSPPSTLAGTVVAYTARRQGHNNNNNNINNNNNNNYYYYYNNKNNNNNVSVI